MLRPEVDSTEKGTQKLRTPHSQGPLSRELWVGARQGEELFKTSQLPRLGLLPAFRKTASLSSPSRTPRTSGDQSWQVGRG